MEGSYTHVSRKDLKLGEKSDEHQFRGQQTTRNAKESMDQCSGGGQLFERVSEGRC